MTEGQDRLEVELKFTATDAALGDLAGRTGLGHARLGPVASAVERDRYLDTADGRLAAARWACRLRTRGDRTIVSLKGPSETSGSDGFHRRPEVEGPANADLDPSTWPASPARDRLAGLTGGTPLVERFALRQERAERDVFIGQDAVATLSLDAVQVLHGGRDVGRFASVELELRPEAGTAAWLAELHGALESVPDLRPDPLSKLEHALALLEHAPA